MLHYEGLFQEHGVNVWFMGSNTGGQRLLVVSNAVYQQVALSLMRGYLKASSSAVIIQNGVIFKYNYGSMIFNCLL